MHSIRMSHWRCKMVDGAKFWIICDWLNLLSKAGRLQLIKNLARSTIVRRQYDIRIDSPPSTYTAWGLWFHENLEFKFRKSSGTIVKL